MASDIIFKNILESMSDGVMTIGVDGHILTFNEAAETILGLKGSDVLQSSFAESFLIQEENDAFNQTILNAIYDANTIHDKLVQWQRGGAVLTLEVTTSFLAATEEGVRKKVAVIVVFKDITEIGRLQESEQRLTEELKENHQALQKSYLEMEEANTNLKAALRKVQLIRIGATIFAILLFLSIGVFTWKKTGVFVGKGGSPDGKAPGASAQRAITIAPQTLTDSISLKGTLKPIQVVNVTSPFGGMIGQKYFEYGQAVTKGKLLLKLDRADTEVKYREAKTAYIEAQEKVKELKNWSNSNEIAKAQQSVTRSKLALDGYNKTLQETERLFKKEIVPATEYASAKQQYTTARMDYESSLRDLEAVKAKGEGQYQHIAKLKLDNARQKLQDLENQLRHSDIIAPVSGTVLMPEMAGEKDAKGKVADRGVTFSQGDILLAIGNTEGLSITAQVDELEVLKIKKDQEAQVSIEAFGETIQGKVTHISSQAVKAEGGSKAANFDVTVAMESLPAGLKDKLRLGMSANMEIMLVNKPNVIMLPIQAVLMEGPNRVVNVRDKATQSLKKVKVETGITTVDAVEITSGLKVGDEVVY
jgi:HlyD family secretion protein